MIFQPWGGSVPITRYNQQRRKLLLSTILFEMSNIWNKVGSVHNITITHGVHCAVCDLVVCSNKFCTVSLHHSVTWSLGFHHLFEAFVLEMFFTAAISSGLITVSHPSGKILGTSWITKTTLITVFS